MVLLLFRSKEEVKDDHVEENNKEEVRRCLMIVTILKRHQGVGQTFSIKKNHTTPHHLFHKTIMSKSIF